MLNKVEKEILHALDKYIKEKGFAPTMRELCKLSSVRSTSTLTKYLDRLECHGYIARGKFTPRALSVKKL